MKKVKILSLVGGLLLLSMFFGSCKDEHQSVPIPKGPVHTIRLDLTANVVKQIDAVGSTQRGFNLDVNHSGSDKTEAIKWGSDTWDNITNRPQLIAVILKKSDGTADKVVKLGEDDYDYNPGHGNKPSQVSIHAYITLTASDRDENYKVVFYLMDKSQETDLQATSGTIKFDSRPGLYDLSTGHPVLQKRLDYNVFVHPNNRIFFNFIFQGEIDLSSYKSTGVKNFDMKPLGTLLMVDFASRYDDDVLDNPTAVGEFTPYLYTNAFDLDSSIDVVSGYNAIRSDYSNNDEIIFEYYPNIGRSTDPTISNIKTISKTSFSDIYVKYVLPRKTRKYIFDIINNNIYLYKVHLLGQNFYDYNTKSLGITLSMTSGSIITKNEEDPRIVSHNALSYVSEYNVASDKESFNQKNSNTDNAFFYWNDAKALFSKPFLQGYHLPTLEEWKSIVPSDEYIVYFDSDHEGLKTYTENGIRIGKARLSYMTSYFLTKRAPEPNSDKYFTYAIRFTRGGKYQKITGCPYLSAWRYAYIDNPTGGKMMEVYCYLLPKNVILDVSQSGKLIYNDSGTLRDITAKDFFESRLNSGAVRRVFPAPGIYFLSSPSDGSTTHTYDDSCFYWSSTARSNNQVYNLMVYNDRVSTSSSSDKKFLLPVRPFFGATQQ